VLNQAQQRITDLERRLSATGEEMDQSAVALQVKVSELTQKTNELWEQMDKLWASAWRRNQSDIADLSKVVNSNKSAADGQINKTSAQLTKLQESLQGLQTELAQQSTSQQLLQDTVADTKLAAQNNEQQLSSMQEKLISSALGNNNLTNKLEDLSRQLKALEKRINALSTPVTTTP
jgi:chromosome segregation ATPase